VKLIKQFLFDRHYRLLAFQPIILSLIEDISRYSSDVHDNALFKTVIYSSIARLITGFKAVAEVGKEINTWGFNCIRLNRPPFDGIAAPSVLVGAYEND
jgi:hypothetical protein